MSEVLSGRAEAAPEEARTPVPVDAPAGPQPTALLTPDEVERFEGEGFLRLDSLMPADEVAATRATLERLFDTRVGYDEGARFDFLSAEDDPDKPAMPQILRPSVYAPELLRGRATARATAIARQLLGEEARLSFDHVLMKPARDGAPTPWHQDDAFADPAFTSRSISIWMALQPVDSHNGCLSFVPGSPDRAVLPHRSPGDDGRVHGLECLEGFDPADGIACPLPSGGATIHTGRTLHGAGANHSAGPRYAFVLVFSTPKRPAATLEARPWLEGRQTARSERERAWMRRGGLLTHAWRRLSTTPLRDYGRLLPGMMRRAGRRLGGG